MAMNETYAAVEPRRAEVDTLAGPTLVEFGSAWCGHCMAAQPKIAAALADHPEVRHIRIADGKGRRLGRSFTVKLWPTLVFLVDGREVARLVRPTQQEAIRQALARIDPVDAKAQEEHRIAEAVALGAQPRVHHLAREQKHAHARPATR